MRISAEFFCAFLAGIIYANTFWADFVYDDSRAILKNRDVLPSTPVSTIFFNDFWGTPMTHSGSHKSYRPIAVLTFRFNYAISGFQPWSYHVTNVFLHALTTWLLVSFLKKRIFYRSHDQAKATFTGLLFAVHPIHTEAVAGVVGRADILATLFTLLALHVYATHRDLANPEAAASPTDNRCNESINLVKPRKALRRKPPQSKNKGKLKRKCQSQTRVKHWDTLMASTENIVDDVTTNVLRSRLKGANVDSTTSGQVTKTHIKASPENTSTNAVSYRKEECNRVNLFSIASKSTASICLPLLPHILTLCAMLSKEQGICALALCVVYDVWVKQRLGLKTAFQAIFFKSKDPHLHRLSYRLRSCVLSTVLLLSLRILPWSLLRQTSGPSLAPSFSESDNPTAASDSLLTRTLTFHYLIVYNVWMLLCPAQLSYDWSIGSISLVESVWDLRNGATVGFYLAIGFIGKRIFDALRSRDLSMSYGNEYENRANESVPHHRDRNDTESQNNETPSAENQHWDKPNWRQVLPVNTKLPTEQSPDSAAVHMRKYRLSLEEALVDIKTNAVCDLRTGLEDTHTISSCSDCFDKYSEPTNSSGYATESSVEGLEESTFDLETAEVPVVKTVGEYAKNTKRCKIPKSRSTSVFAKQASSNSDVRVPSTDIVIFGLSVMVISFLPATNLFFYVGFVVAERLLYLPSVGFCLLVSHAAVELYKKTSYSRAGRMRTRVCLTFKTAAAVLLVCFVARTVFRNDDWKSEYHLYRSGIAVSPAKSWANIGNILKVRGSNADAELAYLKALEHRKNMADVHYNLGLLYQEQKRFADALSRYDLAIKFRPTLAVAYLNSGIVLAELGRSAEAEKVYRRTAQIPDHGLKDPLAHARAQVSALYNLGNLLAAQNRHQEAVDAFFDAARRRTPDYEAHSLYNMLGQSLFRLKRTEEAEKWFSAALREKADHAPAHLTYALLLSHTNRRDEAERLYQRSLTIDPENLAVYIHFSKFYTDQNKFDEAAQVMDEALKTRSGASDFETAMAAANAHRHAKSYERAEQCYRATTRIRPKAQIAHMNLGAILHLRGKYEEARQSYQTALSLGPSDPTTLSNLAKLEKVIKDKG